MENKGNKKKYPNAFQNSITDEKCIFVLKIC